jgi:hypothetical protein
MRITRARLMIATAGLSAILLSGCHGGSQAEGTPVAQGPTAPTAVTTTAPASPAPSETAVAGGDTTPVVSQKIGGTFFYWNATFDKFFSYRDGKLITLASNAKKSYYFEASPDGSKVAWIDADRHVQVKNSDGTGAHRLNFVADLYNFDLTWTADGTGLVLGKKAGGRKPIVYGVLRISDGRFTPLPASIQSGIHFQMTPDGKRYLYIAGKGALHSAAVDGTDITQVPVVGDLNSSVNPRHLQAMDIISSDRTGSRITADVWNTLEYEDPTGSEGANMVIDTAAGKVLPLPVTGKIQQLLMRPDGTLLVVTRAGATNTLTLLSADLKVLDTEKEPAATRDLTLIDHRR